MIQQDLFDLKATIADLHNHILTLAEGLWLMNTKIDEMMMSDIPQEPEGLVEMEHTEMLPIEIPAAKPKGRQKREPIFIESPPEPPERLAEPDVPETLPPLSKVQIMPQNAPEPAKKPSVVERLLGKDADQKARLRAERTAKLEKELAELNRK